VWQLARGDYAWLTPKLAPIYRDFALADLRPLLAAAQIDATVLVQAAPTVAETEFMLAVAAQSDGLVRGVVGWVDFAAADAVAIAQRLARNPLLKSLRPMLQDLPDAAWILRPDVDRTLAALPALGLRFDALVTPRELPALATMVERHPALRVVIDHGAKPPIASGQREPWAGWITRIAQHPQVCCKLSGLATEAARDWTVASLAPYVEHLIACFGPQRLLWGSDWPVVDLAGGHARWHRATLELLAPLTADERAAVLGGNARRFYGLGD
jgi:L-fuconolactonase